MLLPSLAQQCYIEAEALGHGAKDLSAVPVGGAPLLSRSATGIMIARRRPSGSDRELEGSPASEAAPSHAQGESWHW